VGGGCTSFILQDSHLEPFFPEKAFSNIEKKPSNLKYINFRDICHLL